MTQTEQINELNAALAKAQGAVENAPTDKSNPHFNSKYTSLAGITAAIRQPFADNGLAIYQALRAFEGEMRLVTRIAHASGQWIEDDGYPLLAEKRNMQGLGSATTYARKYGLMNAAGIAPVEDDDGNAATGKGGNQDALKGGARRKKDDFAGKGVMKLKEQARELNDAMDACETLQDFEDLIATNQKTLDQIKADIPNWWHSAPDSDVAGIEDRIMRRREQLRARAEFEVPDAGPAEPLAPGGDWTDDGLLIVPQADGVVLWDAWSKQFLVHELNKAADVDAVKALGEKYKATFASLKMQDAALHKKVLDAAQARKAKLAATAVAAE